MSTPPEVRKGQGVWPLPHEEFVRRARERFYDPNFNAAQASIDQLIEIAWKNYCNSRKSPRTRKAGPEFSDPEYELSVQWLAARERIRQAQREHDDPSLPSRLLLICGAARNDKTCPGEISKTFRLLQMARAAILDDTTGHEATVDTLDLSVLVSDPNRVIYPCKACVSTAMPLCHWPCSCYPNYSLGQVDDWMNDLYPRWVAAHGVMIITPVYWYQAPGGLKSMMDRLVCADGGNPDPTSTAGKDAKRAKEIELAGWDYPRHLAGRAFSIVVHSDTEGALTLRRSLVDWLQDLHLVPAGRTAVLDRYVGYYEPYATSHDALDRDLAFHDEVRNAARSLVRKVQAIRSGQEEPDVHLEDPRPK
jgi:multimeric flavodoxin WrbA